MVPAKPPPDTCQSNQLSNRFKFKIQKSNCLKPFKPPNNKPFKPPNNEPLKPLKDMHKSQKSLSVLPQKPLTWGADDGGSPRINKMINMQRA